MGTGQMSQAKTLAEVVQLKAHCLRLCQRLTQSPSAAAALAPLLTCKAPTVPTANSALSRQPGVAGGAAVHPTYITESPVAPAVVGSTLAQAEQERQIKVTPEAMETVSETLPAAVEPELLELSLVALAVPEALVSPAQSLGRPLLAQAAAVGQGVGLEGRAAEALGRGKATVRLLLPVTQTRAAEEEAATTGVARRAAQVS